MLRSARVLLAATLILGALVVPAGAAPAPDGVTGTAPTAGTPNISSTRSGFQEMVREIAPSGAVVAAGGSFDEFKQPGATRVTVSNFVVWDAATSALRAAPIFNNEVLAVQTASDGISWYVGGKFSTVDGVARRALVRVNQDGVIDPTFKPRVQWAVQDLALAGDRLYVAGNLVKVDGQLVTGMAVLDATTGRLISTGPVFSEPQSTHFSNGDVDSRGSLSVDVLAVSDDGTRLLTAGNYRRVNGVLLGRVAQFDISTGEPLLLDWRPDGFDLLQDRGRTAQIVMDAEIAPGGDYAVIVTTGNWGVPGSTARMRDTATRWELDARGLVHETWTSRPGHDSLFSVEIGAEAVYLGGHFRWMNNPLRRDDFDPSTTGPETMVAGPGAVRRYGLAAVDARNGVPLDWVADRDPRGLGAFDLTLDESGGLWIGHDTGKVNGQYRGFAVHLPADLARTPLALPGNGTLPVQIALPRAGQPDQVRTFDGASVTSVVTAAHELPDNTIALTGVGDDLLFVTADATMWVRDQGGAGASQLVDLGHVDDVSWYDYASEDYASFRYGLPDGEVLPDLSQYAWDLASVRSLGYDPQRGELLYTLADDDTLYARGYTHDTRLVEAMPRVVATSSMIDWSRTRALLVVGQTLYYSDTADRSLHAVAYGVDGPAEVAPARLSGPDLDGRWWVKPAGLLTTAADGRMNAPPVAAFDVDCVDLVCTVDGAPSTDTFGRLVSWSFAGPASVLDASHGVLTMPSAGTHSITLTVTDEDGAAGVATQTVTVP